MDRRVVEETKGLIYSTEQICTYLPDHYKESEFSDELIKLWNSRTMEGKVYECRNEVGLLVGFLLLEEPEGLSDPVIRGLYVDPEYRGNRIATTMLSMVTDAVEYVWVNVLDSAKQLYLKSGFSEIGPRKDFENQIVMYYGNLNNRRLLKLLSKAVSDRMIDKMFN